MSQHKRGKLLKVKSRLQTHATILQMTDLHASRSNREHIRAQLRHLAQSEEVRRQPVDAIVVCGDLVNNWWSSGSFDVSLDAVEEFAKSLGDANILVVPGNHDVKVLGNFFRYNGSFRKRFSKYFRPILFSNIGLFIHPVDSTPRALFARGHVSREEVDLLQTLLQENDADAHFRVAVLHHYVLPTPELETGLVKVIEPYMELEAPGVVLSALLDQGVSLVMHGHHHSFTHWSLSQSDGNSDRRMELVGCGSFSDKESQPLPWAILHGVYRSGAAVATPLARPGSASGFGTATNARTFRLTKKSTDQGVSCKRVVRIARVFSDGDALCEEAYHGVTGLKEKTFPRDLKCNLGHVWAVSAFSESLAEKPSCVWKPEELTSRVGRIEVSLNQLDLKRAPLSLRWTVQNAVSLTRSERARNVLALGLDKEEPDRESFRWTVPFAVGELVFFLFLPHDVFLRDVRVKVLDPSGVEDPVLSDAGQEGLSIVRSFQGVRFRIEQPVVGYTYCVSFHLPDEEHYGYVWDDDDSRNVRRRMLSQMLDQDRRLAVKVNLGEWSDTFFGWLRDYCELEPALCDGFACDFSFWMLDDESGGLRCMSQSGGPPVPADARLAIGEGVVGRAFKLKSAFSWYQGMADRNTVVSRDFGTPKQTSVFAAPVLLGNKDSKDVSPRTPVLGVVCIAMYKIWSGNLPRILGRLKRNPADFQREVVARFSDEVVRGIVDTLEIDLGRKRVLAMNVQEHEARERFIVGEGGVQ